MRRYLIKSIFVAIVGYIAFGGCYAQEKVLLDFSNQYAYKQLPKPIVPRVPCMMTKSELRYLYWLASQVYTGQGAIVEIGTWLGGSAGYLATGLKDSGINNAQLYCIDRFYWRPIEIEKAHGQNFPVNLQQNKQDTSEIVKKYLTSIYPKVSILKTSIKDLTWNATPIEILHIDAPKDLGTFSMVLKRLSPFLIPGVSIVVLQDFFYPAFAALPILMGMLSAQFKFVHIPYEQGSTASFIFQQHLDLKKDLTISRLSDEQIFAIWDTFSKHITCPHRKAYFDCGLALFFYNTGNKELAYKLARAQINQLLPTHSAKLQSFSDKAWNAIENAIK